MLKDGLASCSDMEAMMCCGKPAKESPRSEYYTADLYLYMKTAHQDMIDFQMLK